ncbi:MAG: hypothetical protein HYZ65_08680 [Burkholderiales bacterium]|nr:hypothetical protein [Burkholderiales bacterium]
MDIQRLQEFQLAVFSQTQCAELTQRLLGVDAFWLTRHASLPFYTLGATNYYDITANPARPYESLAQKYNPFLLENFPDVYDAVLAALAERLQQAVVFLPGAAVPGFHIFAAHPAFEAADKQDIMHGAWFRQRDGGGFPGNPIHIDSAHLALGLPAAVTTMSFTLAVAVPQAGAGLKIWPLASEHTQHLSEDEKLTLLHNTASRQLNYRAGQLCVHSGDFYHQARGFPFQGEQYRITLQGHGAWLDGQWHIFW